MSSPRRQHYDFAHRLLPKLIADSPDRVLDILAGDQGDSFVEQMWRFAAEGVPETQRIAERPVRHVRHLPMGQLAVILALPPTAAVTEAHLVAIVSTAPKGVRYFTLEAGVDRASGASEEGERAGRPKADQARKPFPEETARTVFCEWTSGAHVNFGSGPAAEIDPFLDVVEAQVSPRQ